MDPTVFTWWILTDQQFESGNLLWLTATLTCSLHHVPAAASHLKPCLSMSWTPGEGHLCGTGVGGRAATLAATLPNIRQREVVWSWSGLVWSTWSPTGTRQNKSTFFCTGWRSEVIGPTASFPHQDHLLTSDSLRSSPVQILIKAAETQETSSTECSRTGRWRRSSGSVELQQNQSRISSMQFLPAYGVRYLQPLCGDELWQLLQTLDEPDLPAELLTGDTRRQKTSECVCVCVYLSVCAHMCVRVCTCACACMCADLMKGLTTVISALMYQAGWTTSSPFRSFFSLKTDMTTVRSLLINVFSLEMFTVYSAIRRGDSSAPLDCPDEWIHRTSCRWRCSTDGATLWPAACFWEPSHTGTPTGSSLTPWGPTSPQCTCTHTHTHTQHTHTHTE